MNILICGGAGYIGSHTTALLKQKGHQCVVFDNLSKGHPEAVERVGVPLMIGDVQNEDVLIEVCRKHKIEMVLHFAAFIEAGVSMKEPAKYFYNNDVGGITLLEAMRKAGVSHIIFSSTAAVYGQPQRIPILEDEPMIPVNFYGETKCIFESLLGWYYQIYGIHSISLRYFNAAGASSTIDIGEDHEPETHLIPNIIQKALGIKETFSLFGTDYETPDGTCIRDYIHVVDLALAHSLAVDALGQGKEKEVYNLGSGSGYSNREIINMVKKVSNKEFDIIEEKRRVGDPAILIASSDKIKNELGWKPTHNLEDIIQSAYTWHKKHPHGYNDKK